MGEVLKIRLSDLNPHIVCSLCAGYFIDATTITECLHTFCKTCIVKYFQHSKYCPQCNIKIHETHPLTCVKPDNVLQDIVYKLVPGLFENEEKRKEKFFASRGLKEQSHVDENLPSHLNSLSPTGHRYRHDEQVSLCLERYSVVFHEPSGRRIHFHPLDKKFIRCSVRTQVTHLEKMLARKMAILPHLEVELLCDDRVLIPDMTMKYVWLEHWSEKKPPMILYYRIVPKHVEAT